MDGGEPIAVPQSSSPSPPSSPPSYGPGNWRTIVQDAACAPLPDDVGATLDTRAYIVMTSGTTGVPKGICCPHRGSVFCYNWRRKNDPSRPGVDVEACNVFFVWEAFRPLLAGTTTLIIPDEVRTIPSSSSLPLSLPPSLPYTYAFSLLLALN